MQWQAVIHKSRPKIKNRCSRVVVTFCRRAILLCGNENLNRTRKVVAATADVGGPFFFAATAQITKHPQEWISERNENSVAETVEPMSSVHIYKFLKS